MINCTCNKPMDALIDPEYRKKVQGLKDVTAAINGESSSPVVFSTDAESVLNRKMESPTCTPVPSETETRWWTRRHLNGQCNLFCDDHANDHYGISTQGLMYRLWRIRIYMRGFLFGR